MKDLTLCFEALGLTSIHTYLQSGNVIFQSKETNAEKLQQLIESEIKERFKLSIRVFIFTDKEWNIVWGKNPYQDKENRFQYITFMEESASREQVEKIREKLLGEDVLTVRDKTLFFYFPEGYGTTKINNQFLEKELRMLTTTRNRNTVDKIQELLTK